MDTWLILAMAGLAGILLFRHVLGRRTAAKVIEANPYYATSISYSDSACSAVKALAPERFLVGEAPAIPVPRCSAGQCDCTYKHYKDRRTGVRDRRSPSGLSAGQGTWGKRGSHGRRKSDWRVATSAVDSHTLS